MEWQPIESVPNEDYDLLVVWDDGIIDMMTGRTARDYKGPKVAEGGYLTHWMLLPERPKRLPTIEEMSGLVSDFTNGKSLKEYMEELSDE